VLNFGGGDEEADHDQIVEVVYLGILNC